MQRKRLNYIFVTLLYMVILCYISLRSGGNRGGDSIPRQIISNFLHIPAYAIMAYLVMRCFSIISYKIYVISFAISTSHGVLIEFLQIFVPHRTASLMDVGLNSIGILSTLLFYYKLNINRLTLDVK